MIHCADRFLLFAVPAALTLFAGCYHPYPYQQPMPYSQPGYAPPQSFSPQQAPGQLIIPPSDAPPYQPGGISQPGPFINNGYDGSSIDRDPPPRTFDDGGANWERSNDSGSDGSFYREDKDGVPLPPGVRQEYDRDF